MATVIAAPFKLTALPASFDPSAAGPSTITKPVEATLIAAGQAYLEYAQRTIAQRTFDQDDAWRAEHGTKGKSTKGSGPVEDDLGVGDEEEPPELLASDPKKWKDLDQYAVLGLSHLRYRATDEQIKIAHRKKVLKHHPDKKAGAVGDSNDDAFFKCIQKAYEVLMNAERRRQFDSIDPYFVEQEDEVPSAKDVENAPDPEKAFFELFGPVFEREAHFCNTHHEDDVPKLGTINSTKAEVEGFYDFWYNFDSWRTFEWHDKEVNEGSNSRDDKRYTEKKNKGERARRKKEDNARLRTFIDVALSVDPRIKKIKAAEKEEREKRAATKQGGRNRQAQGPKLTPREKEELAKKAKEEQEKKDEEERLQRQAEKKIREAEKKKAKKAKKAAEAAGEGAADGDPADA